MQQLTYLAGYPEQVTAQISTLVAEQRLGAVLLKRFPRAHEIKTDRALYDFTMELKNQFLRKAPPLSKVTFDSKINVIHHALGLHTFISRVQGASSKRKTRSGSAWFSRPHRWSSCA